MWQLVLVQSQANVSKLVIAYNCLNCRFSLKTMLCNSCVKGYLAQCFVTSTKVTYLKSMFITQVSMFTDKDPNNPYSCLVLFAPPIFKSSQVFKFQINLEFVMLSLLLISQVCQNVLQFLLKMPWSFLAPQHSQTTIVVYNIFIDFACVKCINYIYIYI